MAEKQREARPVRVSPALAMRLAGPEFRELAKFYAMGELEASPSWRTLELAARDRAHQIGITQRVCQRQCEILGGSRATLSLLVADHNAGRSGKYRVRNAAAAFIGIARGETRQSAVLDGLIGELLAFAKGAKHD